MLRRPHLSFWTIRDLYYRLCVFCLSLPPLRERGDDILTLASHFTRKHSRSGAALPRLSPGACSALMACDWPGNVRELENAIIRAVQRCRTGAIEAADLGLRVSASAPIPTAAASAGGASFNSQKRRMIEAFERQLLTQFLTEHKGNVTRAAQAAGRERRDFGKLLKKYRIDVSLFTASEKPFDLSA